MIAAAKRVHLEHQSLGRSDMKRRSMIHVNMWPKSKEMKLPTFHRHGWPLKWLLSPLNIPSIVYVSLGFVMTIGWLYVVLGVYSWSECDRGSWFIEALTDKLKTLAYEDIDLIRILTRVINEVANQLISSKKVKEKVPSITSMLTKDIYFTRKPDSSS